MGFLDTIPVEPTSEPNSQSTRVTIPLGAGGTLVVVGPEHVELCDVCVLRGAAVLDFHRLKSGEREQSVLPPGRYRVGVVVREKGEGQPPWTDRFDAEHVADVSAGEGTVLTPAP